MVDKEFIKNYALRNLSCHLQLSMKLVPTMWLNLHRLTCIRWLDAQVSDIMSKENRRKKGKPQFGPDIIFSHDIYGDMLQTLMDYWVSNLRDGGMWILFQYTSPITGLDLCHMGWICEARYSQYQKTLWFLYICLVKWIILVFIPKCKVVKFNIKMWQTFLCFNLSPGTSNLYLNVLCQNNNHHWIIYHDFSNLTSKDKSL